MRRSGKTLSRGFGLVLLAVAVVVLWLDNGFSAAILRLFISTGQGPFATFVVAYALACLAGQMSTVPGGLGVFESALAVLAPHVRPDAVAAGLASWDTAATWRRP